MVLGGIASTLSSAGRAASAGSGSFVRSRKPIKPAGKRATSNEQLHPLLTLVGVNAQRLIIPPVVVSASICLKKDRNKRPQPSQ